ncbi:hypothetical protein GP486_004384 [Trichoglossum hirsutum]|uniref:Heterokaryon incompatibility domain-containing protein n=1 Tax=Trichoglossum hirsutum TaxID=265104 RepID=A0A9P8LAY4_9PEZI|nr:hypothetical protein GP486_004384 [Trichoglossum hirsutum]
MESTHISQGPDPTYEDAFYQYQPLAYPDSIRLLELNAGEPYDPIVCMLQTARLEENPSYEAISYVWGDRNVKRHITCGFQRLDTTVSLHDILRELRRPEKPRLLWADAVCINQNDIVERGQQVGIMGSIYAKAARVVIWLGHDEEHVGPEILRMVSQHDTLDSLSQSQTDAVAGLLKTAWFSRVWVIQEAALSQSPYVLWGQTEINWRSLVYLLKEIGDQRIAVGDLWNKVGVEWNFWLAHGAYNPSKQSLLHLVGLLYTARGHSATDPRDHVYAFLGHPANLLGGRPLLRAEYTRTRAEVFRDATVKFLRSMGNLDILSYVTHGESLHLQDGLPSWVPMWDCLPLMSTGFDVRVFPFPESGLFREEIRDVSKEIFIDISDEDRVLSLRGLEVDVVEWHSETIIYKMIPPGLWDCGKEEHPLEKLWTDLKNHCSCNPYDGSLMELFSLLLTSGLIKKAKVEDRFDEHNANFQAWRLRHSEELQLEIGELFPGRDQQCFSMLRKAAEGGNWAQFVSDAFRACNGRKVFTTKNGHLGVGPMAMRSGDIASILFAARTAFILRPAGDQYILVGEAYLHGSVHDEVVAMWKKGQLRDGLFKIV